MARRVVVAMSGGVDSSVAAYILREQGYDVIGVGLRLPALADADVAAGACCGIAGMEDAQRVAAQIGIPFYVLNYERRFMQAVVEPFCQAYAAGQTPNPCVDCNTRVKFGALLDTALALGAEYIATGHYARLDGDPGRLTLRRASDPTQDQSYFLWGIPPARLAHTLFPLGALHKSQVRQIAAGVGLHVAHKPGSQDICFLQGADYRAFLLSRCPQAFRPGPILDAAGAVLGEHCGVVNYTIGQRRGLRLAAGRPLYVQAIDAARAAIIVGPKAETSETLILGQVNWLAEALPAQGRRLLVKTRYRGAEAPALVMPAPAGGVYVRFERPQPPAAAGQSAVFYDGDRVAGGGVIQPARV